MTPIMHQYNLIKKKHLDCIVFFRLGDFYEMFYEDAYSASEILGITLTKRIQKDEDIPMSGVPYHTAEHYIAKLVKAGKKIAICEQVGNASDKSDKIINREVVRIITPGTITDDNLLNAKRNNFLIALNQDGINISCAIFDLSTNEFFIENFEAGHLKDQLEKIDPSEILMNQNFLVNFKEYENWKQIITLVPEINKNMAVNHVLHFFNLHSIESLNYKTNDLIAIAMIIEYLKLTQKNAITLHNISQPKYRNNEHELQIDKFTRRNLEITKTLQNAHYGSLLWLLDETKTSQGARSLFQYLSAPVTDINQLNERYDEIDLFMKNGAKLENIRKNLSQIPDFERLFGKITLNRATPRDLLILAQGIQNFINLSRMIDLPVVHNMPDHSHLAQKILSAIEEEPGEKGYIKLGFDSELDSWKNFEKDTEQKIQNLQNEYKVATKIANLRIKFHTTFGYIIEINSSQKDKLDYNYVFRQDLKSVARYTTNLLENINIKLAESSEAINLKEKEIFHKLCKEIAEIAQDIRKYSKLSAHIDLFTNFAYIAGENGYIRPILSNDNKFEIQQGKHPVLEKILKTKGQVFVANDCNLDQCVMFMTGPNMAGKSTYLRQQALIALLAHIGMFVPAHSAKIGIIDHIFSRIGASDNLIEGNSTFMMEMIEIALTLNQATNKSFIVFDEVGRGTSVEEGMAIAQAILEYLAQKLCARAIFATHYLALQKIQHANLQQKMMEIIEHPIHFTHKILDGVAKKSYALSVAEIAGMPSFIVERAREILG